MKLSFDWFVSKIHEVFEGLPDHRKFSPHRRYSMKDAAEPVRIRGFCFTPACDGGPERRGFRTG